MWRSLGVEGAGKEKWGLAGRVGAWEDARRSDEDEGGEEKEADAGRMHSKGDARRNAPREREKENQGKGRTKKP